MHVRKMLVNLGFKHLIQDQQLPERFFVGVLLLANPFCDALRRLRTVPTFVTAHTFCASQDTRVLYGLCLLIQGYFCVA